MAQNPRYTRESMFLRVHSTLPPFPFLQTSNWKRPSCTQKPTATSSPAGCPGKGQPRDTIDGGSKVVYANHDRGRETRPNLSVKGKPSPARTRFNVRRKTNATERAPFFWTPQPRAMATKTGKRKPGQVFPSRKNSPSTRRISHAPQN